MQVISVQQPWPYAIFHEGKNIENRRFKPRQKLPMELAIQVSKKVDLEPALPPGFNHLADLPEAYDKKQRGHIIGVVTVTAVSEAEQAPWRKSKKGQTLSRYGWHLTNPRLLSKPVEMAGNQSIKQVPTDLLRKIRRQLKS